MALRATAGADRRRIVVAELDVVSTAGLAFLSLVESSMAAPLTLHDYMVLDGPKPSAHLTYGSAPSQFVELFEPVGDGPFPVVFLVHGGCWTQRYAGIVQMRNMAGALAAQGVAVWNVEYRRVDEPGGGYPGTFQDVVAALDLLRASAADRHLDLNRLVAVGHSAGGHLIQWLAGRARLPPASPLYQPNPFVLRRVIALGTIGDLEYSVEKDGKICGVPVADLVGKPSLGRPNPYADTSPAELLPNGSRTILINGALDTVSPPASAVHFAARATAAGDSVETVVVPDASHYDEVATASPAWQSIFPILRSML